MHFFAPDFVWSVDRFFTGMKGAVAERSEAWELGRGIRAVTFLIIGVVCLLLSFVVDI